MSWPEEASFQVGTVTVATSSHGGHPPEFFAERIVERLIQIGDQAPEPIRAQAYAFRDRMHAVILDGIKQAIATDRIYRK